MAAGCLAGDALTEALAAQPYTWSFACLGEVVDQGVLRELFVADQQLLLKAGNCCDWGWHVPQQQAQRPRLLRRVCRSADAATKLDPQQHDQNMQASQVEQQHPLLMGLHEDCDCTSQPPVVVLRQPSSSASTSRTSCNISCSQGSSDPSSSSSSTCSTRSSSCSSSTRSSGGCQPACKPPTTQEDCQHSMSEGQTEELEGANAACCTHMLSSTQHTQHLCDDVSAQKAAAQAQFAQQQLRQQSQGSCASDAILDAALLQEEEARLLRQDLPTRMFWLLLVCNMLCCACVVAAKACRLHSLAGSSVMWLAGLLLSVYTYWVIMSVVRPLQFAHAALEQQYAARHQTGRRLLDLWFSLAGCAGILATVRRHATAAGGLQQPVHGSPDTAVSGVLAGLMACVLLSLVLLMSLAPKVYRHWREMLLLVVKLATILGVVLQASDAISSSSMAPLAQQSGAWYQRLQGQAGGVVVAMSAMQAFLLLALMVRVSAYIPMQLLHVTVLLVKASQDGSSGLKLAGYAVQLLACGLWIPVCLLAHLEVSARRSFLVRCRTPWCGQANQGSKSLHA